MAKGLLLAAINFRNVALYHLIAPEVVTSDDWKKAVETPWTERLRPHMRDRLRVVCKAYEPRSS